MPLAVPTVDLRACAAGRPRLLRSAEIEAVASSLATYGQPLPA